MPPTTPSPTLTRLDRWGPTFRTICHTITFSLLLLDLVYPIQKTLRHHQRQLQQPNGTTCPIEQPPYHFLRIIEHYTDPWFLYRVISNLIPIYLLTPCGYVRGNDTVSTYKCPVCRLLRAGKPVAELQRMAEDLADEQRRRLSDREKTDRLMKDYFARVAEVQRLHRMMWLDHLEELAADADAADGAEWELGEDGIWRGYTDPVLELWERQEREDRKRRTGHDGGIPLTLPEEQRNNGWFWGLWYWLAGLVDRMLDRLLGFNA